ncbi:MAG TPA: hypothetical protein VMR70_08140 [Flavisolibacter sp.]|nr:hypothetical protein [Flavisolibacter sp.]
MMLKMMVEGKLIGLTEVDPHRIKGTMYLHNLREALRQKYKSVLLGCAKAPTFLLEVPATNG